MGNNDKGALVYNVRLALKSKHLGKFGSYTSGEPLFAMAEEVLAYREGLA